ncbi:superinfection exclusion B family protein [Marinobacter gelidimuriae]|uniref:superinfection exclusion B family protein n=1 Tax=Marinobacter gelidimuriae TaxID=2739064 RepID=UPI00035E23DF|nr:superinfection exclusion B family protein [Marinobacter gelidimuriae]
MDPSKWFEWVKLPTKTLAALCIVFGIMVFSGDAALEKFGLKELVQEYRAYLGAGFLMTLALTLVNSLAAAWKFIYPWIAEAHWVRLGRKRLQRLNPTEKDILRYYIHNQTRSQSLPIQDGTVNGLQREKIIIRGSSLGSLRGFDFIIQPWAWEYLNERPELLD